MATGGGGWLDGWKKKGELLHVLHREGPVMRHTHNFRQIRLQEDQSGVKKTVGWLPWNCWEEEGYHRARRQDQPTEAKFCPGCRLIEYFEAREDLGDDTIIFSFIGTGRERRDITLIDFVGLGKGRESFKDNFVAEQQFLISLITPIGPGETPELKFINERWSMAKRIQERVETDIKHLGEDAGEPSVKPIAYLWKTHTTGGPTVERFAEAKITPAIQKLWEGPPPPSEESCRRGDPNLLLEQVKLALREDQVGVIPLDDIFGPAIEEYAKTKFPPDEQEEVSETEEAPKSSRRRRTAKPATATDEVEKLAAEPPPPPPTTSARTQRAVRPTKAPPPPPTKPEVQVYECPACKADWPEDQPTCPKCGAEADDGAAEAPPPPATSGGVRKPTW
jgi:hypothetical protein